MREKAMAQALIFGWHKGLLLDNFDKCCIIYNIRPQYFGYEDGLLHKKQKRNKEEVASVFGKFLKAVALVMKVGPDRALRSYEEARTDYLTGLLNRRGLMERLDIETRRVSRYGGRLLVAHLDLDDLWMINDREGYEEGDKALAKIADAIKSVCRSTDFAARVGGDEFVVVFVNISENNDRAIGRLMAEVGGSASVGYRVYSGEESIEEVIRLASCDMKKEKERKKKTSGKSGRKK